jgi:acetyl/propionyl-CoA carboxylase alpha subunit
MRWIDVDFQGKRVRVPVLKHQGKLWMHWRGETYNVDVSGSGARSASGPVTLQPGLITAPMPGKVTRVHVKVGDTVQKGQPLVVMEAMKMEYTLEADIDGKVTDVNVAADNQVSLGAVLVQVAKPAAES